MTNALQRRHQTEAFSLVPRDFAEAMEFARLMASSTMVPKDYIDKPANVLIAVQMGSEVNLSPMQAIQNIAVINGRPCLWGDAMLAIVQSHPQCTDVREDLDLATMTATCTVRRRGRTDVVRTFSREDAQKAGLWGKQGPWTTYPQRMLAMRARSWACRDQFADALRGISSADEMADVVDARTGDNVERPAGVIVDASPPPQTGGEDVAKRAAEIRQRIEQATCQADMSAIANEIRVLPRDCAERKELIDAGVAKNLELENAKTGDIHDAAAIEAADAMAEQAAAAAYAEATAAVQRSDDQSQ